MTFHRADADDLPALTRLEIACFTDAAWSTASLAGELDRGFILIAPLAYVVGLVIVDECELLRIGVHPDARRQGLGQAALDAFHHHAWQAGAIRTLLEVRADNDAAIRLYTSDGYVQEGRRRGYYAGGTVDALLFGRALSAQTLRSARS
ncbi:MAG: GNAT family N-acetyltransferase [Myxococcota bacterium]